MIAPKKGVEGIESLGLDEVTKARFVGEKGRRAFHL
jgi:hypothetical protein